MSRLLKAKLSLSSHRDSAGAYRADNLFGAIRPRGYINSTFVCDRYQTRFFEVAIPYLHAPAHTLLLNILLKIRDAMPEYYGKVSSHYNMIPMVIAPVSGLPSDGGQFVLYSIYTKKEVCYGGSFYSNGRYSHLDGSGLIGHQLHYFTGKFFIGYQNVILDLAEHDVTVKVAKAFCAPSGSSATGGTVYYLALLLQSVLQPEANHRVVVYRVDVAKLTLDRVQSIHYSTLSILDLTLYSAAHRLESSILLSLAYDGPSSVLYPNAHAQSNGSVLYIAVMKWNTVAQLFQSYMSGVDQYCKYSPSLPYRSTRFFSNFWGTFLAISTVGRDVSVSGRQGCTANFDNDYEAANFVDIWHYTPEHAPQGLELYRRLDLGTVGNGISGSGGGSGAIEALTIGADFYLLTLSGDDHLLMSQHRGVNQFGMMARCDRVNAIIYKVCAPSHGPSTTTSGVYYLALLLKSVLQPEANHRMVVYRVDVAKRTLDRVQSIHYSTLDSFVSILDLDLILYAAHLQFESSILLSLVYDGPSSVLYPNAHAQSNGSVLYSAVMKWNTGAQLFQPLMSGLDQYRKYSPSLPYRSTRFFSNFWGTFLALSTVGRDVTTSTYCTQEHAQHLDEHNYAQDEPEPEPMEQFEEDIQAVPVLANHCINPFRFATILIVGQAAVGKSTLARQVVHLQVRALYEPSPDFEYFMMYGLGLDYRPFVYRFVIIPGRMNNDRNAVQVGHFDTAIAIYSNWDSLVRARDLLRQYPSRAGFAQALIRTGNLFPDEVAGAHLALLNLQAVPYRWINFHMHPMFAQLSFIQLIVQIVFYAAYLL